MPDGLSEPELYLSKVSIGELIHELFWTVLQIIDKCEKMDGKLMGSTTRVILSTAFYGLYFSHHTLFVNT